MVAISLTEKQSKAEKHRSLEDFESNFPLFLLVKGFSRDVVDRYGPKSRKALVKKYVAWRLVQP